MLAPRLAVVGIVAFATLWALPCDARTGCSHDAFTIDSVPIEITICVADGSLVETVEAPGRPSISKTVALPVAPGTPAHAIDDIALGSLGPTKTLHLTIGFKAGTVRLEHALVIPGATALR